MNILIFTEGGEKIGYGHITRCLSVYQAFIERGFTPKLIINGDNSCKNLVFETNYIFSNWLLDINNYLINTEIAIIDSYKADISYYEKISNNVIVPVFFDDFNRLKYPRGIVINGAIGADNINYPLNNNIVYLLGLKYQPIRKAFWTKSKKVIHKNIERILITLE